MYRRTKKHIARKTKIDKDKLENSIMKSEIEIATNVLKNNRLFGVRRIQDRYVIESTKRKQIYNTIKAV